MGEPQGVIGRLVQELTKLPGIGPKSAERIAHFLLAGDRKERRAPGRRTAGGRRAGPAVPRVCFNLTDAGPVSGLRRPAAGPGDDLRGRDAARPEHLRAGGQLPRPVPRPRRPAGPARQRRAGAADVRRLLKKRVQAGGVREVILATSPTMEGDGTALFAANLLAGTGVAVTRLARGLPSGSSLELANAQMLADALEGGGPFEVASPESAISRQSESTVTAD